VTITANPTSNIISGQRRYAWSYWNDGKAQTHTVIVSSSAATYTAYFQLQYYLTLGTDILGTVVTQSTPDGWYNAGSIATIIAVNPSFTTYTFSHWIYSLGGVPQANLNTITVAITMSNYVSVLAHYSGAPTGLDDLSSFWQYLYANDIIGFIIGLYGIWFSLIFLVLSVPLYIRTNSLTYVAVLWALLSGILSILPVPAVVQQVISLFIWLTVTGIIFIVFDRIRR